MKEAQSHMTWLMLLPMLPGYALMAYPLKSELWQYAVPFLSQNQMLLKVIRHETITRGLGDLPRRQPRPGRRAVVRRRAPLSQRAPGISG
jgi:hypothetical protein